MFSSKRGQLFKFILVGIVLLNLAVIALHWGTVLFLEATPGGGLLFILLYPVLFIDAIVSAVSVIALVVLIPIFRPAGRYLLTSILTLVLLSGYALYTGLPAYEMIVDWNKDEKDVRRVISREEGLKYFEQCRVHGIRTGDPLDDYSGTGEERSGIGGLSVAPLEGGGSSEWWHSFDMKDYWAYQAANFANFGTCKVPVYPDDNGFQHVEFESAVSMLNQCQFAVVMYWTDDNSGVAYGFVRRVAEEFKGIAYGYESQPTVLFASEKMAPAVQEAAQSAKATCDKLQIVENYPVSNFRRDP